MFNKAVVDINFSQGLDTKTDPNQIPIGKFSSLVNSVFTKGGLLQKRNGFAALPSLPDATSEYTTTFNSNLTALGNKLEAFSESTKTWLNKGYIQPLTLSVLPIIRNNLNQTQADSVVTSGGLVCTAYTELNNTTTAYKYVIADSTTGQNIVPPTLLTGAHPTLGTPRVFLLSNYFVIVYTNSSSHLVFIAISINNPSLVTSPATITLTYAPAASVAFDGAVLNETLYLAWAYSSGLKMAYITPILSISSTFTPDPVHTSTIVSVCADSINQVIWASYYNSGSSTGYSLATDTQLNLLPGYPVETITTGTILNLSSVAQSGLMTLFYEVSHSDNGIVTNFIDFVTVTQSSSAVSSPVVSLRSVGLASKAFIIAGVIYYLATHVSLYQPTYFLVNGSESTSANPMVISEIAYENGGGYYVTGTPSVMVYGTTAYVAYLYKDLIEALSNANAAGTITAGGIYSQTGINLVKFVLGTQGLITSEIGTNLNITGGFLWAYDGYSVVEQGFHLWPDSVQATWSATGGLIAAQPDGMTNTDAYSYQVTYEWSDNQGNIFRSAGSIPVFVTTTGSLSTGSVTLIIPTLRVTAKISNPVKIVIYRWSVENEEYRQVTSITAPLLNSTTTDSVTYVDTLADASIAGNNIIYTTGGVIEDTGAPSSSAMTLFDDRLWLVDAEDPNLLWFSKQVIESTPVEMSDLLTFYVAPTIGSQGSTGPITSLSTMDDKLIIFKQDAIYYINGTGPDNTGANSQYSQPIFITSAVGCANQKSIVLSPTGIMFQSDKGIWILGRDLSTSYIGAPVEAFNGTVIQGSLGVPGTNQDRFTNPGGICEMWDYYYEQWGTFNNVPALSSTLYQGLHTYISSIGQVFQESPGTYTDGTNPVLMSFTTGWLNLAGLQGYQQAFFFYLLGLYYSPFKLICSVAYDYNPNPYQFATIQPTNLNPVFGGPENNGQITTYGSDTPYGGQSKVFNQRVFLKKHRCSAIQISIQEIYDASFGIPAGQGLSLSGLQLVYSVRSPYRPMSAAKTTGAS